MNDSRPPILSDELLRSFHERAPVYDRENRFFSEDFEDLRKTGYLRMAVPRELGGLGLSFADCMRETRRLAYWAPATALGTNMHWYNLGGGLHLFTDSFRRRVADAVVRDGAIVVRPMMYVALTYDHRVVDGREAVSFLVRVKEMLEDPARLMLEV